ncbi:MAG TPA: dihydrodipicolinate synthase family protein [Treponema sp.]|nr:MAG: dihydrodipicolinate synthase family protein [Treponema sp. GWC1_61_84]HCM27310.1 dihydrodipicolinate synthase family protein [Treponema sp.]
MEMQVEMKRRLLEGLVIPAMPLALDERRLFDRRAQRALVRYYVDSGAGGIAAAVHSTQFAIRKPEHGLLEPVLRETAEAARAWKGGADLLLIAGVCGRDEQAENEARLARDLGYQAGLVSLSAFGDAPNEELLRHCRRIAAVLPVFGFYLQPAVGGRVLDYAFWRAFAEIGNVAAVKIAPFDRYRTLEVIRAVADSGRLGEIALYTGNDDTILVDLLTDFRLAGAAGEVRARISGGLLGHWSVWTKKTVELFRRVKRVRAGLEPLTGELLTLAAQTTDANGAFFDAAHSYAGVIPGIHEVLRAQGLLSGTWCLDPGERLSPGQIEEIDRVRNGYPHLADDDFVRANLDSWKS